MGANKLQYIAQYENLLLESLRAGMDWDKILISGHLSPSQVLTEALLSGYSHVCQTNHPYFIQDLNTAALMLQNHKNLIMFPFSTILSPGSLNTESELRLKLFEYTFSKASQKSSILDGLGKVLNKRNISTSIQGDVVVIADELITNAVFNAPYVDMANSVSGVPRDDQTVSMGKNMSAKLFFGADDARLVIGCRDPYGTLNLMRLIARIKRCYETSVAQTMNMTGRGGAGIGSFMVFNSSASYYAVVEERQCTMILCSLPVKMSSRTRLELPKNLHLCKKK